MSEWFLEPARLWLLAVVVALVGLYVALQFTRPQYTVRFSNLELLDKVAPQAPRWRRHVTAASFLVAVALLVVSFAQPVMTVRVPQERTTIMLAFDTSLSMAAEDVDPSRLEAAQTRCDRVRRPTPRAAQRGSRRLRRDGAAARAADPGPRGREAGDRNLELDKATAIGDAVKLSLDVIGDQSSGVEGDSPEAAIVLISDGETTVGPADGGVDPLAREAGVAVSTIAYGTPNGEIMVDEDGDGVGQLTGVPVNVDELSALADGTGGTAFTAESATDLEAGLPPARLDHRVRGGVQGRHLQVRRRRPAADARSPQGFSLRWFSRLP